MHIYEYEFAALASVLNIWVIPKTLFWLSSGSAAKPPGKAQVDLCGFRSTGLSFPGLIESRLPADLCHSLTLPLPLKLSGDAQISLCPLFLPSLSTVPHPSSHLIHDSNYLNA